MPVEASRVKLFPQTPPAQLFTAHGSGFKFHKPVVRPTAQCHEVHMKTESKPCSKALALLQDNWTFKRDSECASNMHGYRVSSLKAKHLLQDNLTSARTCTVLHFEVQRQGICFKTTGLPDAIANAPVYADSQSINFRSNVRGTAFRVQRQGTCFKMTGLSEAVANAPEKIVTSAATCTTPIFTSDAQLVQWPIHHGAEHHHLPTTSELITPGIHGHKSIHGRRLHDSPHKHGHSHSPKVSQMQKNSAESSCSRTGSPVRSPSLSRVISPLRTLFDRFSPLSRDYSAKGHSFPSIPSASPPLCRSIHSRDAAGAAVSRHWHELQRTIDACEVVGTECVQYYTSGTVLPFPEDWVPPNVSLCYFHPGRGERSVDPHGCLISCTSTTCVAYTARPAGPRKHKDRNTHILVPLAPPWIWLAYSVLALIVAMTFISFIWRTGASGEKHAPLSACGTWPMYRYHVPGSSLASRNSCWSYARLGIMESWARCAGTCGCEVWSLRRGGKTGCEGAGCGAHERALA
ncbi:hypothetical protein V8E53_014305 [Lactarius tabidus]